MQTYRGRDIEEQLGISWRQWVSVIKEENANENVVQIQVLGLLLTRGSYWMSVSVLWLVPCHNTYTVGSRVAVGWFQYAFAEFIVEDFGVTVVGYSHGEAFFSIEFHLPVFLPFFQGIQILLEGSVIVIIHYLTIDDTVVGKKSDIWFRLEGRSFI